MPDTPRAGHRPALAFFCRVAENLKSSGNCVWTNGGALGKPILMRTAYFTWHG
jgi:hypothetical protein